MAKLLLQDPAWARYKAQRYLAASGAANTAVGLELWQQKVALRLYTDLGVQLPSQEELALLYKRFSSRRSAQWLSGAGTLDCAQLTDLLNELLEVRATVVTL